MFFRRESYECVAVIIFCHIISALESAACACVHDTICVCRTFQSNRLHHAETRFGSVTGIYIHMFTPQTLRTVIGIATAGHFHATMLAREIL